MKRTITGRGAKRGMTLGELRLFLSTIEHVPDDTRVRARRTLLRRRLRALTVEDHGAPTPDETPDSAPAGALDDGAAEAVPTAEAAVPDGSGATGASDGDQVAAGGSEDGEGPGEAGEPDDGSGGQPEAGTDGSSASEVTDTASDDSPTPKQTATRRRSRSGAKSSA